MILKDMNGSIFPTRITGERAQKKLIMPATNGTHITPRLIQTTEFSMAKCKVTALSTTDKLINLDNQFKFFYFLI